MKRSVAFIVTLTVAGAIAGSAAAQQAPKAPTSTPAPSREAQSPTSASRLVDCTRVIPEQRRQCEYLRKAQEECRSAPDFRGCVRSKM
jgi:hypothetical protein